MIDKNDIGVEIPSGTNKFESARNYFWTNIRCRVLFCILEVHGDKSISELSQVAKMNIEETVFSLEALETLGFIKKTPTGYAQLTNKVVRLQNSESAKTMVLNEFLIPNLQIINEMLMNPQDPTHYLKCLVYNSKSEFVLELQQKIAEALMTFKEKSDACDPNTWDGVYSFSAVMNQSAKLQ